MKPQVHQDNKLAEQVYVVNMHNKDKQKDVVLVRDSAMHSRRNRATCLFNQTYAMSCVVHGGENTFSQPMERISRALTVAGVRING